MLKADLHIHSNISDGSETIESIIKNSIDIGLDIIAFTEHDTLSHQDKLPLCEKIKILSAVEISCVDYEHDNIRAHILGYNIKDRKLLEYFTLPTLEKRHKNTLLQIDILNKNGYNIDVNKLNKADGKYIYKQHIMEYLVKSGQVCDMFGEFYKKTFKNNGICDFDIEYPDAKDAVKIIASSGGKAVLAHSGQQQNFFLIEKLVRHGLQGLEYNHISNSEKDKKIILDYACKFNLFLTGGSDFHGTNEARPTKLGEFLSPDSGILAIV